MSLRDLSHGLTSGDPYPGDPPATVSPHATMAEDGYRVAELACSTHSGTHIDAPAHLVPDGATLGEFEIGEFRFDARVVDCTEFGSRAAIPGAAIPPADDSADLLVVHTGWSNHWGEDAYFDHPYLSADAAAACVERGFAVGLDTPSVDPTPTENVRDEEPAGHPAHEELLGAGTLILENLTNLGGLPGRVTVHAYPLPVDADGAPVRAVASW